MTLETDKELSPMLERAAAELWKYEHPEMSCFEITTEMKRRYRRRALAGERAPKDDE